MEIPTFAYMRWTKEHAATCRLNLTASGVPCAALPPIEPAADYRVQPVADGDPVNEALLAERYGVPRSDVLFVPGTTMANFAVLFALLKKGERVLVETPAYENLPGVVRLLGGEPIPLPRPAENDFAVDVERAEAAFREGVRLAILTDLHNPSGVALPDETLTALRAAAARHGATIVLDEVYRDFRPGPVGTGYRAGDPTIVVTSSLTKVYGMGALRTGFLFAPPALRRKVAELLDYLVVLPPAASCRAAEHVLRNAERFRAEALARSARGLPAFEAWAAETGGVRCARPAGGLVVFPAFEGIENTDALCERLRTEADVLVAPGRFFEAPDRIRLSVAPSPDVLREGLDRIRSAMKSGATR